jgi:Asp-tRNA(Asn)/Glu-tRNA(Gln) amidotransferase C subunit
MGRKPAKVRGLKWREDRGTWEARYDVNGKRVRKSFTDRSEAIVWIARGLKHREGLDSLPTSATEPTLTVAEKKAMREEQVNSVTLGVLCNQYLAHIQNPTNPERPKDQRNPPQRVSTIKAAFGDRPAASLKPYEIKDWLISLGLSAATLNRYKSTLSAIFTYAKEREQVVTNPVRDVPHFKVADKLPRWMSDEEEDKLRRVIDKWL